jgi:hypothetical protein
MGGAAMVMAIFPTRIAILTRSEPLLGAEPVPAHLLQLIREFETRKASRHDT